MSMFDDIFNSPITKDIGIGLAAAGLVAGTIATAGALAPADAAAGAAVAGGAAADAATTGAAAGTAAVADTAATTGAAAAGAGAADATAATAGAAGAGAAAADTTAAVAPAVAADAGTTLPTVAAPAAANATPTALTAARVGIAGLNAFNQGAQKVAANDAQQNAQAQGGPASLAPAMTTPTNPSIANLPNSNPSIAPNSSYGAIFGSQSPAAGNLAPSAYGPPPIQPIASDRNLKKNVKSAERSVKDFLNQLKVF